MQSRGLKLIGAIVGVGLLVALLGMTAVKPIARPAVNLFARPDVVQMLQEQFAELEAVATKGELLDFGMAVIWSDESRVMAFIPPHSVAAPEILSRKRQLRAGEEVDVPFGGLYVGKDLTRLLPVGAYRILVRRSGRATFEAVFINSAGDVMLKTPARVDTSIPLPERLEVSRFRVEIIVAAAAETEQPEMRRICAEVTWNDTTVSVHVERPR